MLFVAYRIHSHHIYAKKILRENLHLSKTPQYRIDFKPHRKHLILYVCEFVVCLAVPVNRLYASLRFVVHCDTDMCNLIVRKRIFFLNTTPPQTVSQTGRTRIFRNCKQLFTSRVRFAWDNSL